MSSALSAGGGHCAVPQLATDPVLAASQFATRVQTIVTRNIDSLDSAVISVTQIQASSTFNIIPDQVNLSGTVRTFKKMYVSPSAIKWKVFW